MSSSSKHPAVINLNLDAPISYSYRIQLLSEPAASFVAQQDHYHFVLEYLDPEWASAVSSDDASLDSYLARHDRDAAVFQKVYCYYDDNHLLQVKPCFDTPAFRAQAEALGFL